MAVPEYVAWYELGELNLFLPMRQSRRFARSRQLPRLRFPLRGYVGAIPRQLHIGAVFAAHCLVHENVARNLKRGAVRILVELFVQVPVVHLEAAF